MFAKLTGKPSLSTMVLSRDASFYEWYGVPSGTEFQHDVEGWIVVTDRAGAELATFEGDPNSTFTRMEWYVDPLDVEDIPAGSNFEMYVSYNEETYMVRYGRVVRREASFPLAPAQTQTFTGALFTDSVGERTVLGPFWIQKKNKTIMKPNGSKPNGMGNDGGGNDTSAVHWYTPLNSDSQKVQVSLMKIGTGKCIVVLCSNYAMTNWIGVMFNSQTNTVQPCTGSVLSATDFTLQSTTTANTVAATPDTYTVWYDLPSNTIQVFKGASLTPLMSWVDSTNQCGHGDGHRYTGLIYLGSGPQVTYWSAKDDL